MSSRSLYSLESFKSTTYRTIAVIGGGVAGVEVIRGLAKKLDKSKHRLVLITSRPRYTYLPASQRLLVKNDVPLNTVFWPYDHIFAGFPGEIIVATVTFIEENYWKGESGGYIVLDTGEKIVYDYVIVSTGSHFRGHLNFPSNEEGIINHVQRWREKVQAAENIAIIGGGPVGIEMAGEIRDAYPTKNVTIIHNNCLLLDDTYPDRFRMDVEIRLRRRHINMIFSESVDSDREGPISICGGEKHIHCDLLIPARGGLPNTKLFQYLRPGVLTSSGYVQVHATLQVKSHPNIYALGDIIEWPEAKTWSKISFGQSSVVVSNIISSLRGKTPKKVYKGTSEVLAVSNGKKGGASYFGLFGGMTFGNTVTSIVKSRDLGVGMARKNVGLPAEIEDEDR